MQPDTFYHIYNHANGSENLFRSDENYHYFLRQWTKYIEPVAGTYAYCLMPNHFHALIRTRSEEDILIFISNKKNIVPTLQGFETLGGISNILSQQFSHLFNGYSQAYNKQHGRKGSLFMPNFKRKEITSDTYFTKAIHYIHHNPVHHRFCKHYQDWSHSSYHALLCDKQTKLKRTETLNWFGGREAFLKFHEHNIIYPEQIKLE